MVIEGGCHCRNIVFTLTWDPEPAEIPARACGCTFCTKHGGVWTSNPAGTLKVEVARPDGVSKYAFGTSTATFHACGTCGVVPVVTSDIEGRLYAVVNVNTFDNVEPARIRRVPASFDDESVDTRLARRKRNWIGRVEFA
jgi:hypothetical protein